MIYIILIVLSSIMAGAIYCACFKPGTKENIVKYDNSED